jgi:CHASE2 domain-containing sensor protein
MQDTLWVVGVLLVAVACLWYARAGLQDGDAVLVVGGVLAAAGFVLAGLAYLWLAW